MRRLLRRLGLSFKKAHKLLGKACPAARAAFVRQLRELLAEAQQPDGAVVVFVDEAHIHLDVEPGWGWAPRGQRLYVNSNSPGLSKKRTCFGLYSVWRCAAGADSHRGVGQRGDDQPDA